jgi:hypothetical protein
MEHRDFASKRQQSVPAQPTKYVSPNGGFQRAEPLVGGLGKAPKELCAHAPSRNSLIIQKYFYFSSKYINVRLECKEYPLLFIQKYIR